MAGGSDAFLPSRALEAAGHNSVPDGARVKVRISQGSKGPQVAEVLEVDMSTARWRAGLNAVFLLAPPRLRRVRYRQKNVSVQLNGTTSRKDLVS